MVSVTWALGRLGCSLAGNADMTVTYGGATQAPERKAQNGSAGGGRWRPRSPAARAGSAAPARRVDTMSPRKMRKGGLEPPRVFSPQDPESCASANSATFAWRHSYRQVTVRSRVSADARI